MATKLGKFDITLEGFEELQKMLSDLPKDINSVKVEEGIMRKAIQIPQKELQSEAERLTGDNSKPADMKLENNVKVKRYGKGGAYQVGMGANAYHARFLNFGTKRRKAKGRNNGRYKGANRGSMKANHFVTRVYYSTAPVIARFLQSEYQKTFQRIVKRQLKNVKG